MSAESCSPRGSGSGARAAARAARTPDSTGGADGAFVARYRIRAFSLPARGLSQARDMRRGSLTLTMRGGAGYRRRAICGCMPLGSSLEYGAVVRMRPSFRAMPPLFSMPWTSSSLNDSTVM